MWLSKLNLSTGIPSWARIFCKRKLYHVRFALEAVIAEWFRMISEPVLDQISGWLRAPLCHLCLPRLYFSFHCENLRLSVGENNSIFPFLELVKAMQLDYYKVARPVCGNGALRVNWHKSKNISSPQFPATS